MRELIFYGPYYQNFYAELDERARVKVNYALYILETQPFVPEKFVKHITNSDGIYEVRASVGSREYRVLFFFEHGTLIEGGKVVVISNGFLKKSDRDYRRAIEIAERIKRDYLEEFGKPDSSDVNDPHNR